MKLFLVVFVLFVLLFGCATKENTKDNKKDTEPEGEFCGGIAGIKCPDGYVCNYENQTDVADAAGTCVPQK